MQSSAKTFNILVVEDEWLIALDLSMVIEDYGQVVIGPAQTVSDAMGLIEDHPLDAAFLDVRLGAENSFVVAEKLTHLSVPLTFISAFAKEDLPAKFREIDMLPKPLPAGLFREQLLKMLGQD